MDDASSREEARFDIGSNAVVEAAAGTGKTSLLVERILSLILAGGGGTGIPIEKIVALTFTKKAAAEMKIRLAERLHEIASFLDGENSNEGSRGSLFIQSLAQRFAIEKSILRARARAALDSLERAPIETLHAFSARLLKLYPLESGLSPAFEVDEGSVLERIFESEWEKWLDRELGDSPPQSQAWLDLLNALELGDLKELALELCREKMDLESIGRDSPETALELISMARKLEEIPIRNPPPRKNSLIVSRISELSRRLLSLAQVCQNPALCFSPELERPSRDVPPESQWPKAWEEDNEGKIIYQRAQKIASQASPAQEALIRAALEMTIPFAREFRSLYRQRGWISFDGLLELSRDILKNNRALREDVKRSYAAFLVDEFQDTDPLQGEILFFLAEAPGESADDWRKVRLGLGRLFVVGDPKQSIYRFRGADIAAYQEFTRRILENKPARAFSLTSNFRSGPGVLKPINELFSRIMREKEGLQAAHQNLVAARIQENPGAVERVFLEADEGKPLDAEAVKRAQALWTARWIAENCGGGKPWRYKDVAVLWRTGSGSAHLLSAFKERRIPYAAQLENSLYASQELVDFINLLRVLDDPSDRISMAGLLRSPLSDIDDATLCRWESKELRSPSSKPKTIALWERILQRLREGVGRLSLGDLIEKIFNETPLLPIAAAAYHGSQSVSNLLKVSRLALAASDSEGLTLREFIERIAGEVKIGKDAGESPLADDSWDCVRVLTIHKAKGLEFPVVIIPAISAKGRATEIPTAMTDWRSSMSGFYLESPKASSVSMALLRIKEEERLNHEAVRLLYVALTRAKDKAILIGGEKFQKGSFADFLSEAAEISRVPAFARGDSKSEPPLKPTLAPKPSPEIFAETWRNRFKKSAEASSWVKSPTSRRSQSPLLDEEGFLGASSSREKSSWVGQLCHLALKRWDFKMDWDIQEALKFSLSALALNESQALGPDIAADAELLLRSFMNSKSALEISQSEILGQEIPFAYQDGPSVMRGRIDLVYKKDGRLMIVDYKTGPLPKSSDDELSRYQEQSVVYSRAVEKSFPGIPSEFRLIFLRAPDRPIVFSLNAETRHSNLD